MGIFYWIQYMEVRKRTIFWAIWIAGIFPYTSLILMKLVPPSSIGSWPAWPLMWGYEVFYPDHWEQKWNRSLLATRLENRRQVGISGQHQLDQMSSSSYSDSRQELESNTSNDHGLSLVHKKITSVGWLVMFQKKKDSLLLIQFFSFWKEMALW